MLSASVPSGSDRAVQFVRCYRFGSNGKCHGGADASSDDGVPGGVFARNGTLAWDTTMLCNMIHNFLLAWKLPRWRWALLTAVLSDALGFGVVLFPPIQWLLDAVTAIVVLAVLGFRWPLLAALAVEAVPGLQVFPAWTLMVLAMAAAETQGLADDKRALEQRPSDAKTS
jgi:hypothetical protein